MSTNFEIISTAFDMRGSSMDAKVRITGQVEICNVSIRISEDGAPDLHCALPLPKAAQDALLLLWSDQCELSALDYFQASTPTEKLPGAPDAMREVSNAMTDIHWALLEQRAEAKDAFGCWFQNAEPNMHGEDYSILRVVKEVEQDLLAKTGYSLHDLAWLRKQQWRHRADDLKKAEHILSGGFGLTLKGVCDAVDAGIIEWARDAWRDLTGGFPEQLP